MKLFFVDVEADMKSPCPGIGGGMTEFAAVELETRESFHGKYDPNVELARDQYRLIKAAKEHAHTNGYDPRVQQWFLIMMNFEEWLLKFRKNKDEWLTFVSDNPAYDWQWINYYFHHTIQRNPMGFSARRIGDYYAGLVNDFKRSNEWKQLRVTKHDHNPVHDALGNAEAFERMQKGERVGQIKDGGFFGV